MIFWIAILYHVASRLAYVGWVGAALSAQHRRQLAAPGENFESRYEGFRRRASQLMTNDAISLVLLCLVTRQTLHIATPQWLLWLVSTALIVAGVGIKMWAAKTLGSKAYYWHNFFVTAPEAPAEATGPYRYISNPMYTVGYLQVYGLALAFGSLPALLGGLFDQLAILVFHLRVERPHYHALMEPNHRSAEPEHLKAP